MINQIRLWRRPRLWGLLCGLTVAVILLFTPGGLGTAQAATTTCTPNGAVENCTVTFAYSGAPESWTVPPGVTSANFVVDGAQGGTGMLFGGTQGTGGLGARAQATFAVRDGQIFQLMVGGAGSVTAGGFNGGGAGGGSPRGFNGAGGGGASDVRSGACATALSCTLADRRIIAGGGGGGAAYSGNGGSGGQLGGNGTGSVDGGTPGAGGTATSGGAAGATARNQSTPATAGQLGLGGAGGYADCGACGGPGGGGGGLYGGGGAGWEGGGGGGSSSGPSGTTFQSGVRSGHGQIVIIYTGPDSTGPVAHPTLSPAANAAGWNNTNVTVNWNWSDSGSGIVNGPCEPSSTSDLGVGTQTLTAYCVDEAGNLTQASYTVKVDRAQPLIRANVSPAANGFGWNNSAVTVSFTCQEQGALSGIATNTVGGNQTFSSEGANFTATSTGTCVDFADNAATAVTVGPIKLDLTKPTLSAAATSQPNANGWYNSDVTVRFTCADNLSGAFNCPADQTLSSEGTAVSSTAQTVADRALNGSDPSNVVTVKLDKTAPSVLVTGVTNGATYAFGSVPTAACSTSDALSGVATPATLNVTGGNPDGSGSFTATCSVATDLAGNSAAPVSVGYTVNAPLLPEIAVTGNGQPINSGSTTPNSGNGTLLGNAVVGSAVTQTFTIANSGAGVLNLNGTPRVAVSGPNAGDFTVVTLPAASVATGSNTTFQVRFTPSATGVRMATLTIANNDSDENPYTFAIQGAGLQSLQPTSQLTQQPGYTQTCVAASAPYVKRCTLSFTLKNTSNGPLQLRYEQLTKVSSHVFVLNGTPNPGQVDTIVTDARSLAANATFPPTFQLGLTSSTTYSLFFKVYGYPGAAVAAGTDAPQAVELGEFAVTLTPDEPAAMTTVFLPLVNR
ncbi:MAG: choice-of-anchor D domain-containing protein [Caldilineaceae bacterium]